MDTERHPIGTLKRWTTALVGIGLLASVVAVEADDREAKLRSNLAYLETIPEIAWVKFESNSVYIGWKSRPADLRLVVNAAASSGNKAIDFGVHVYNYHASQFPTPTTGPRFFCTVTCRHGKHSGDC